MLMKGVKYLCEDVHKAATTLPINFHSQQCELRAAALPVPPAQGCGSACPAGEAGFKCDRHDSAYRDFEGDLHQLTSIKFILLHWLDEIGIQSNT